MAAVFLHVSAASRGAATDPTTTKQGQAEAGRAENAERKRVTETGPRAFAKSRRGQRCGPSCFAKSTAGRTQIRPIKHAKAVLACGPSCTEKKTAGLAQVPGTT